MGAGRPDGMLQNLRYNTDLPLEEEADLHARFGRQAVCQLPTAQITWHQACLSFLLVCDTCAVRQNTILCSTSPSPL